MGGDCKSPGSAFEGSNPSPATIFIVRGIFVNPHTFEGSNPSPDVSYNEAVKFQRFFAVTDLLCIAI